MRKHNGMRPQDIVILLQIMIFGNRKWTFEELATSLLISVTEISFAMERNKLAGLVNPNKTKVNKLAFRDFLIYGIKYVFPPQIGHSARGIATAHSAPPVKKYMTEGNEHYVWAYYKGTKRGNTIVPLYSKIPKIVESQPDLYELLTIIDTLRVGKKREVEIAINELDKRLNAYE